MSVDDDDEFLFVECWRKACQRMGVDREPREHQSVVLRFCSIREVTKEHVKLDVAGFATLTLPRAVFDRAAMPNPFEQRAGGVYLEEIIGLLHRAKKWEAECFRLKRELEAKDNFR